MHACSSIIWTYSILLLLLLCFFFFFNVLFIHYLDLSNLWILDYSCSYPSSSYCRLVFVFNHICFDEYMREVFVPSLFTLRFLNFTLWYLAFLSSKGCLWWDISASKDFIHLWLFCLLIVDFNFTKIYKTLNRNPHYI